MKVLVMYASRFAYHPAQKNVEEAPDTNESAEYTECMVAFIQIEKEDEEKDVLSREKKLVNHLKWTLRKNTCTTVILHSFAHLSDSKASFEFTRQVFDQAEIRLQNAGITTAQTPFGYFLDLDLQAPGFSLARIWASL
ncbi:MAG TPA: threonyl-tRNA synthetase editing domain-containing protein [Prolixibacteraceae bacterium]|nr:threonyl-tRNA synthetase editing domain-containing protein [Prolixibacteraceae bacterium]